MRLIVATAALVVFGLSGVARGELVAFFDNPAYTDPATESANLAASLTSLGHTVSTFSGITAADWRAATVGGGFGLIVIPELDQGDLFSDLDADARAAIRDYVSLGGGLLMFDRTGDGRTTAMLNGIFGFSLVGGSPAGPSSLNAGAAAGTDFAAGPASLPDSNSTQGVTTASLPPGAKDIYNDGGGVTTVFVTEVGAGEIGFLGFDWFETPTPAGWEQVLGSAVTEVKGTPLGHFLCYKAKGLKQKPTVTLADQFDSGSYEGKGPKLLCGPADKNGEGIQDLDTNLAVYKLKGPHAQQTGVLVVNQLGAFFYDTKKTLSLMTPTRTTMLMEPPPGLPDPDNDTDHYRCLKAKATKKAAKLPKGIAVTVADQFGTRELEIKTPFKLCVPTDKNGEGIKNPAAHLMCYKVKPTPKTSAGGVQINNQFGPGVLSLKAEAELCVPSLESRTCGDGTRDGPAEQCDSADFGPATCVGFGFSGGSLACSDTCRFDTSGCSVCGNGTTEPGEGCDGGDDLACPGLCSAICRCGVLSPASEDLTTCIPPVVDTWQFSVTAGQAVSLTADTVDAATAADLTFNGDCGGVDFFGADDSFACTFPPPVFACPMTSFMATVTGSCTVNVRESSATCADPATANYSLAVTLDAVNTLVTLSADDQPF